MAKLRRIMRKSLKARRRTSGATVAVLSHPLFFCAAGAARGGGARRAEQAPQLRQEYGNKTFFNIAILHRSLFFVNRAFMTLFDNLNIHFVVLGAGALQRKHIFLCSILERTKGGKKAYLILPPPPLQPFNASRGEITGFPLRRRQPAFISGKKVPLSRVSSFSLYFAFQSHPFLFALPGGRILAGLFCPLVSKCVS